MRKIEELLSNATDVIETSKLAKLLKKEEEKQKKKHTVMIVLAVIGALVVIAGAAYAVYRFLIQKDEYDFDEFEDEFEDDFEDDFFEDDVIIIPADEAVSAEVTEDYLEEE